jgi:hypothetical protein
MKTLQKVTLSLLLILLAAPAVSQVAPNPSPLAVELAIPFGTVPGKLLLLGNYIVFLDEQQPENSIVIAKSAIQQLKAEGAGIAIQMKEPVRARAGEVLLLNFRTSTGGDPALLTTWFGTGAPKTAAAATPAPAAPAAAPEAPSYQVKHDHRVGSCTGRLIITADKVTYESIESVSHSRRWEYREIKEANHPNPYEVEIKPFSGSTYKFLLDAPGMEPAAYKSMVDRVVAARAAK